MASKTLRTGTIVVTVPNRTVLVYLHSQPSILVRCGSEGDDFEYVQVRSLGEWHLTRITSSWTFWEARAVCDDFGNLTITREWRHVR